MNIGIFTRGRNSHSHKWEGAFARGLEKHDNQIKFYGVGERPGNIDLAVMWGSHNTGLIDHFRKSNTDYLLLERGYVGDRMEYTSCGFNGLNGNGDFQLQHVDDKRIHLFEEHLKPARESKGSYVVIMGQVPSDAAVKYIGFESWVRETYLSIDTDKPIYFRPHPLDKRPNLPKGLEIIEGDLHDILKKSVVRRYVK